MMHCIILTISERAAINSERWQRNMKNGIKTTSQQREHRTRTTTTMTDNNKVGKSEKTNSIITKQVK